MKRLVALSALCVLVLGESPAINPAVLAQNGTSGWATGHGQVITSREHGSEPMTFSFGASVQPDGLETGQGEIAYDVKTKEGTARVQFHFAIDCVNIPLKGEIPPKGESVRAFLSGIVTQTSDESEVATNSRVVVAVEDNGEGVNEPPDRMSFFTINDPADCISCRSPIKWFLQEIDLGNIQVRSLAPVKGGEK